MIELIYAADLNNGIGKDGILPWGHLKPDMKWFREKTVNKVVLMGRETWESLPCKLSERINVVMSTRDTFEIEPDAVIEGEADDIIEGLKATFPDQDIVIIGGANVYHQLWEYADRIHITTVQQAYECDRWFGLRAICQTQYRKIHDSSLPETNVSPGLLFESYERILH